jgi:hypothetical protein
MRYSDEQRMAFCLAALFRILVHVILDVAIFCLRGTRRLFDRAFDLLRSAADGFAGDFLNFSCRFFDSPFDLIFVDAHAYLLRNSPADGRHV